MASGRTRSGFLYPKTKFFCEVHVYHPERIHFWSIGQGITQPIIERIRSLVVPLHRRKYILLQYTAIQNKRS